MFFPGIEQGERATVAIMSRANLILMTANPASSCCCFSPQSGQLFLLCRLCMPACTAIASFVDERESWHDDPKLHIRSGSTEDDDEFRCLESNTKYIYIYMYIQYMARGPLGARQVYLRYVLRCCTYMGSIKDDMRILSIRPLTYYKLLPIVMDLQTSDCSTY